MRRAALVALVLAPLSPVAAVAQVTPERAAALQTQLQEWLQSTVGPSIAIGESPVKVTAAGDHFDLAYPLVSAVGAPMVTGKMTDADGGRWAISDITIPSPSTFHMHLPPDKKGGPERDATTTLMIGKQQQSALVDPNFATPTTASSTFGDMSITTQLPGGTQLSHIDSGSSTSTITPASEGRVNISSNTALKGYTIKSSDPSGDPHALSVAIGSASVVTDLGALSRDRAMEIVRAVAQASQTRRTDKAAGASGTPQDRQNTLSLLSALGDLAQSGTIVEKVDDVTITTQGMNILLKQLSLGLDSKTADGKLQGRMPISADGLTLPDVALGGLTKFVPTHLSLAPTISSVPTRAVMQMAKAAIDQQEPDDQDIATLFADGPINAGIDDLQVNVAGSSFAGHMAFVVASPSSIDGTGQITAENIDKLQQAISADPQSAPMAPLVIFLKGIARSEQSRLVWDIVYRDGRVVVNGQDMAALTGAPTPPPAAPVQPRQGNRPPRAVPRPGPAHP